MHKQCISLQKWRNLKQVMSLQFLQQPQMEKPSLHQPMEQQQCSIYLQQWWLKKSSSFKSS